MPIGRIQRANPSALSKLNTFVDYKNAEEEFRMKKQAAAAKALSDMAEQEFKRQRLDIDKQIFNAEMEGGKYDYKAKNDLEARRIAAYEQQVAAQNEATRVSQMYNRDRLAFDREKMLREPVGGDLPAAMRIANKMQELQDIANNPNVSEAERKHAVSLYNHLGQAAKTYGFDRGVTYSDSGAPEEVPGFSETTGGIKATEAGLKKTAELNAQASADEEASKPGKESLSNTADRLLGYYDELEKLGGAISPDQSTAENIAARTRGSVAGQYVEGYLGTEQQTVRDKIAMARPAIINDIRQATGMSAKALDSNVELKFYLQQATDPAKGVEANREAIQVLKSKYGLGGGTVASDVKDYVNQNGGGRAAPQRVVGQVYDGYEYLGGPIDQESSYRKVQ